LVQITVSGSELIKPVIAQHEKEVAKNPLLPPIVQDILKMRERVENKA